jgi:hypothetical protein
MDLFVFVSGYLMGSFSGASIGILTWLVYGTLNPYGFNLPILVATCLGESFYGIVGGFYSKFGAEVPSVSTKNVIQKTFWETSLKIGIVGFFLTFLYDMFTNMISAIIFETPFIPYLIAGIPLALVHESSNFFFFFLGGNLLINVIKNVARG